jgi:hypothetical protein
MFLPSSAPILLVPGDLGVRLGEQSSRAPFRGLPNLCRLVLRRLHQAVQARTQPTFACWRRCAVGLCALVHRYTDPTFFTSPSRWWTNSSAGDMVAAMSRR